MSNDLNIRLNKKLEQLTPMYKWRNDNDIAGVVSPVFALFNFAIYLIYNGFRSSFNFDWLQLGIWVSFVSLAIYLFIYSNNKLKVHTDILEQALHYDWCTDAKHLMNKSISSNKELRLGDLDLILDIQRSYLLGEIAKNDKIYRESVLNKLAAVNSN